jgi:hypothetical protein
MPSGEAINRDYRSGIALYLLFALLFEFVLLTLLGDPFPERLVVRIMLGNFLGLVKRDKTKKESG